MAGSLPPTAPLSTERDREAFDRARAVVTISRDPYHLSIRARGLESARADASAQYHATMGAAVALVEAGVLTQRDAAIMAGVDRQTVRRFLGLSHRGTQPPTAPEKEA